MTEGSHKCAIFTIPIISPSFVHKIVVNVYLPSRLHVTGTCKNPSKIFAMFKICSEIV